jgi:flavin-binding protein dodecin
MTDFEDASRKATQKARETLEKGRQAAEETVRGVEQNGSAALDNIRNLNLWLMCSCPRHCDHQDAIRSTNSVDAACAGAIRHGNKTG